MTVAARNRQGMVFCQGDQSVFGIAVAVVVVV
jgi:hypothetical protein